MHSDSQRKAKQRKAKQSKAKQSKWSLDEGTGHSLYAPPYYIENTLYKIYISF